MEWGMQAGVPRVCNTHTQINPCPVFPVVQLLWSKPGVGTLLAEQELNSRYNI